jgi:hypothetical protein
MKKEEDKREDKNHEKWATLTYCGKELQCIAKELKGTHINTIYKISNAARKIQRKKQERDREIQQNWYLPTHLSRSLE